MKLRSLQFALLLALAACGASSPTNARDAQGSGGPANLPASDQPFATAAIATFDNPWAIAFLPNRPFALVTEKPGRLWWIDVTTGRKIPVTGVPAVAGGEQGGLLDVAVSPDYSDHGTVYFT